MNETSTYDAKLTTVRQFSHSLAHQARDYRYYKRHNFNALPMEDYEVRDVMNR
jgi:hypothetical protein